MNDGSTGKLVGLGLIIVGALAMAIAPFLPLVEPTGRFSRIGDNSLIQHGGWWLIVLALGAVASGYGVTQDKRGSRWGWVLSLALGAAAVVIVARASDKGLRTLYPVRLDGTVDASVPGMVADLGVAVYIAGAGLGAAVTGALVLLLPSLRGNAATNKCPDCAETILADARVCKHCGHHFSATDPSSVPSPPSKVRNHRRPRRASH